MTRKIAVSLPDHLVEAARRAVDEGRAASVSAYVAQAIEAFEAGPSFRDLADEVFASSGGPPSSDELRRVRRALGWE